MGLSSLAIVLNIIGQVYSIDIRLNTLMQEKLNLSRFSTHVARMQGQALQLRENDPKSRAKFRFINFVGERPSFVGRHFTNVLNPAAAPGAVGAARFQYRSGDLIGVDLERDNLPPAIVHDSRGSVLGGGWRAPALQNLPRPAAPVPAGTDPDDHALREYIRTNPGYEELGPGEMWLTKEQIEGNCKAYLAEINAREKELDFQLEDLRSRRTALTTQKEEFTKYVQQGIQSAFKNNYA